MSSNLAINDVLITRAIAYTANQVSVNRRFWLVSSLTPNVADQDVATQWDGILAPDYKSIMSSNATWRGISVQRLDTAGTLYVPAVSTANEGVGTAGTQPLPGQCCGLYTFRTAIAGRKYRGRIYLPFPDEADNSVDGMPSIGYGTRSDTIAVFYANSKTVTSGGGGSATLSPILFNKKAGTKYDIVDYLLRFGWATQRRRGTFGEPNTLPF